MKRLLTLAALLSSCAAMPATHSAVTGAWGGNHVGLRLGLEGGTLDYDCAHGTIGPVSVGADGRFVSEGTHTPEHGGPAYAGEVLQSYRAHYEGTVRGDRMTLRGNVANGVALGPYELERGAEAMIFRCL